MKLNPKVCTDCVYQKLVLANGTMYLENAELAKEEYEFEFKRITANLSEKPWLCDDCSYEVGPDVALGEDRCEKYNESYMEECPYILEHLVNQK